MNNQITCAYAWIAEPVWLWLGDGVVWLASFSSGALFGHEAIAAPPFWRLEKAKPRLETGWVVLTGDG